MPGIDSAAQIMKYSNQPVCATTKPLDADASVRGTDARLVKSANCVAVYRGSVVLAMYATNAARVRPVAKVSNP